MPAMASVTKASEIVLAEYSPNNRRALRQWLDRDPAAFDWTPHFNFVVQELEGKGEEALYERQEQVRRVVKAVVPCDMTQEPIVEKGYDHTYDVVISSLAIDTVPRTYEEFEKIVFRVGKLVKKGGSIFLYFAGKSDYYTVGDYEFECFSLSSDMALRAVASAGFKELKMRDKYSCTSLLEKYDLKMFFLKAIKL